MLEVDSVEPSVRSAIMARVRSRDTAPELAVRSHLHKFGLRYVVCDKRRPGAPDISFPARKVAVFVHGCFWHGHDGCRRSKLPATRAEYWEAKIARNRTRCQRSEAAFRSWLDCRDRMGMHDLE